jgi:hypothetical protein
MFRKSVIGVFALLLVAACIYFYFRLSRANEPIANALKAIPTDAALILECRQTENLFKQVDASNIMWEDLSELQSFSSLRHTLRFLDSVLAQYPHVLHQLDGHPLFVSAHPAEIGMDFLVTFATPSTTGSEAIRDLIQEKFILTQIDPHVFSISTSQRKEVCYGGTRSGLVFFSTSETLLRKALAQSNSSKSLLDDQSFVAVLNPSKSARFDLRLFVNYTNARQGLSNFIRKSSAGALTQAGFFAGWTELDLHIKPKAISMAGFSSTGMTGGYLEMFKGQEPQSPDIVSAMPSNTASFLSMGFSDFHTWYKNYSAIRSASSAAFLDSINKRYDIDFGMEFSSWIENETASLFTEPVPSSNGLPDCAFSLLRTNNAAAAGKSLNSLSKLICKQDSLKYDSIQEGSHTVYHLPLNGLLQALFGQSFSSGQSYYTFLGSYILFGNSPVAIENYLHFTDNDHCLSQEKHYKAFFSNLASRSNIYWYSHLARSRTLAENFATESEVADIQKNTSLLLKFEALGLQFSSAENLFYNTAYLEENPVYKKETASLWEARLDTSCSSAAHLLKNHLNGTLDVFVQDDAHKIYLISNTGKVLWSKELPEKIISHIIQVDIFKNKKLQMIFNTPSHVYCLDRNGKELEGFPIALPSSATNGITVCDYDHNSDYRILLACSNLRILNYNIHGKSVEGWSKPITRDTLLAEIQYHVLGGKDYLVAVDKSGNPYLLDRHGELRMQLSDKLPAPLTSFNIESSRDLSHTFLVASSGDGQVTRLSLGGKVEHMPFGSFGIKSYFLYKDLNGDRIPECIFLRGKELSVFTQDNSLLFSYTFSEGLIGGPFFVPFPDGHGGIGLVSENSNELFLLNESGRVSEGFPLQGATPFCTGNLNNDNTQVLITALGKNIYAYSLP